MAKSKHGGRPQIRKLKPGRKAPLSVRLPPKTKQLLKSACRKSGRSLSAEAEHRIEQSFHDQEILDAYRRISDGLMTRADANEWVRAIKGWLNASELRYLARTGQRLELAPVDSTTPIRAGDVFQQM